MGVKGLAAFLRKRCAGAFAPVTLHDFKNKTIAVDASVLAYKFAYYRKHADSAAELVSAFLSHYKRWTRYYSIQCIYVFDGPRRVAKGYESARRQTKHLKAITSTTPATAFIHTTASVHTTEDITQTPTTTEVATLQTATTT